MAFSEINNTGNEEWGRIKNRQTNVSGMSSFLVSWASTIGEFTNRGCPRPAKLQSWASTISFFSTIVHLHDDRAPPRRRKEK